MNNLRHAEARRPRINYLEENGVQAARGTTDRMRYTLVDWMVEVHQRFRLEPETMFLAVEILDRFLNVHPVPRRELQLAACTAMMIAAKYEEIYPPSVGDYHYICAHIYSNNQILEYELLFLAKLDFTLTIPTAFNFVRRLTEITRSDPSDPLRTVHGLDKMTAFVSEAALLCYPILCHDLSKVAAASVYLARRYLAPSAPVEHIWTHAMSHYSGYAREDFASIATQLNESVSRMPTARCRGLFRKYERPEAGAVSVTAGRVAATLAEEQTTV